MIFHRFTCTIYALITTIVDEQEVMGYETTPLYSGACNYWDIGNTGKIKDSLVLQDDFNLKLVDLPLILSVPDFSKIVLDNGKEYKVVRSDPRTGLTFDHTLLTCDKTDG